MNLEEGNAAESSKLSEEESNDSIVRYRINARDEITFVGESWHQFAIDNDRADLAGESVLGRSLWDFIADEPTRQLYQRIITRVRQGRLTRFTLRCDSPSCQRLLEMTVSAGPEGAIEFKTIVLREEYREPVTLLAQGTTRSADFLRMCAWCNRINVGSDAYLWLEVEDAIERLQFFERDRMPRLTHGMCEACQETMKKTLDGEEANDELREGSAMSH